MTLLLLTSLNVALGAVIAAHSILELNRRSPDDDTKYKAGTVAMTLGGVGIMLGPVYGYSDPHLSEVVLNFGAAVMLCTWHWRTK